MPRIAFDANGNAFAIWQQSDTTNTNTDIYNNRYISRTDWSVPFRISPASGARYNHGTPRIAFDSNNNAIAVWKSYNAAGTYSDIYANEFK